MRHHPPNSSRMVTVNWCLAGKHRLLVNKLSKAGKILCRLALNVPVVAGSSTSSLSCSGYRSSASFFISLSVSRTLHTLLFHLTLNLSSGMWYNYTTYGAKGLDLLPHKEFWRDLPALFSDLASHITSSIRGSSSGSSRGGYTAI